MRAAALAIACLAAPFPAAATGLACTFTQLCSPMTDCQTHPGLPFSFDLISGALALVTPDGIAFATPLSHVEPPASALLFDTLPDMTLLLTLSETGQAAMTQHEFGPGGQITPVSYFGTCEPAS